MNRLPLHKQGLIASLFVENASVRTTARKADVTVNTAMRNLVWIGEGCQKLHDALVCELRSKYIQADELWSLIHAKDKNLPPALRGSRDHGDMYTWIAIEPQTRLWISWHIGKREYRDAQIFCDDLASRVVSPRVQITTDQLIHYRAALEDAFGDRLDYATVRKSMGKPMITEDGKIQRAEKITGERRAAVFGNPDPAHICTHSIESHNLILRMANRRYLRNSNSFSRKIENKRASMALHFAYFNFCQVSHPLRSLQRWRRGSPITFGRSKSC